MSGTQFPDPFTCVHVHRANMETKTINPEFALNPEFDIRPPLVPAASRTTAEAVRRETPANPVQSAAGPPIDDAIKQFRIQMEVQGLAANSIKAIFHDLTILATYFAEDTQIDQIEQEDLEGFLHWLEFERGIPCNKKTLARRITSLKTFFRWLQQQDLIPHDPAATISQVKVAPYVPVILDKNDVRRLMATASSIFWDYRKPDARPLLLLSLLLQTGIKKRECMQLQYADFTFGNRHHCTLAIRYPPTAPAHKARHLPISHTLQSYLHQYRLQYAPDAEEHSSLFNCTDRNLEYVLEELGQLANIQSCKVGFEVLRWTCTVNDFRTGMPATDLRQKLGLSRAAWRDTQTRLRMLG